MAEQPRDPQTQAVLDAYKLLYDNDRAAAKALLRELGLQYHTQTSTYLEEFRVKLEDIVGKGGGMRALNTGYKIAEQISNNVMGDMQSMAGGAGGLGEAANEFGKIIGDAVGAATNSEIAGKVTGVGIELALRGFGMYEQIRMIGARMAPMITAGRGDAIGKQGSLGFAQAGAQALSRVAEIQLQTGASQQEVMGVLTGLSRVGIAFDDTGKAASRYMLASDMVLNLEQGTTEKITETLIRAHGQAWKDVTTIIQDVTESTAYWAEVNAKNKDGLSESLSGNMNVVASYQAMERAMANTNVDMTGLTKVMLGFRDVMGSLGVRPAMMTEAMTSFFKGALPQEGGTFESSAVQTWFMRGFLSQTAGGRAEVDKGLAYAQEHNIDPMFLSVALDMQLGAKGGIDTADHYGNMLWGIATEKATYQGNQTQQNTAMMIKLQKGNIVSGPVQANLVMAFADAVKRVKEDNPAMPMDQVMHLAGKDKAVVAAMPPSERGKDAEKVVAEALTIGTARLSTERKLELLMEKAANNMKPLDWKIYGSPTLPGEPDKGEGESGADAVHKPGDAPVAGVAGAAAGGKAGTAAGGGGVGGAKPPGTTPPASSKPSPGPKIPVAVWTQGTINGTAQHTVWARPTTPPDIKDPSKKSMRDVISRVSAARFPGDPEAQQRMLALAGLESTFRPTAVGDSGLAEGLFQMHPELRKKYGLDLYSSPEKQTEAASSEMKEMLAKHGGDWNAAIEEYHLGTTAIRRGEHAQDYMSKYASYYAGEKKNALLAARG